MLKPERSAHQNAKCTKIHIQTIQELCWQQNVAPICSELIMLHPSHLQGMSVFAHLKLEIEKVSTSSGWLNTIQCLSAIQ